jgi:hypothetical protein
MPKPNVKVEQVRKTDQTSGVAGSYFHSASRAPHLEQNAEISVNSATPQYVHKRCVGASGYEDGPFRSFCAASIPCAPLRCLKAANLNNPLLDESKPPARIAIAIEGRILWCGRLSGFSY